MTTRAHTPEARLAKAVLELARSGDSALAPKPQNSRRPVELSIEFDEAYTAYVASLTQLPSDAQLESLQAVDAALAAISGPANSELGTESAVRDDPRWAELRALAQNAATQFEWLRS